MPGYALRKRLGLLTAAVILAVLLLPAARPASAARSFFGFYDARARCDQGGVRVDAAWNLLPGATIREWEVRESATLGTATEYREVVADRVIQGDDTRDIAVPPDGTLQITVEVTDANGALVSTALLYAACPSGDAWTRFIDGVPGQLPPPPDERVMVEMRVDTPIFPTPELGRPLLGRLRAGQTWFAIGMTETNGVRWVQIYVGGDHAPWVPASTVRPLGPLPALDE